MPSQEDIFLLNLLFKKELVSFDRMDEVLSSFYKQELSGKKIALDQLIEKYQLLSKMKLQELKLQVTNILDEIRSNVAIAPGIVNVKECITQNVLGKSALGTAYLAVHSHIGKCVIKDLDGIITKNKKFLSRFLKQLKKALTIRHPNFATIFDIDCKEGKFAREFINGESLENYINSKNLDYKKATQIIYQVASGLEVAHNAGILHKNLKPTNIFLINDGCVKVADFCLPPTLPFYLSPEQWEKRKSDIRSDIYSMGIIYYQMLNGMLPFKGTSRKEIKEQEIDDVYKSLKAKNKDLPDNLINIVEKMLKSNIEERFQNCSQILDEIKKSINIDEIDWQRQKYQPLKINVVDSYIDEDIQEDDRLMHTSMMASMTPSVDVIKHRRAKRIAKQLVQDIYNNFKKECKQACKEDSFYEDLAPIIGDTRKKFQRTISSDCPEELGYFDAALENLIENILKDVKKEELHKIREAMRESEEDEAQEATMEATPSKKGFTEIDEDEIRNSKMDIPVARLDDTESSEDFDEDGQEIAMVAEAVEDDMEEEAQEAQMVDDDNDSPSIPQEDDFKINFEQPKKAKISQAFPKLKTFKAKEREIKISNKPLPSETISKEENDTPKSEEKPKKKLKPYFLG